ncbi:Molybdenum cofactor synthesis protein 1 [Podochytrium sp. JEL0797]|nr:Molybdenum cofactor synthesis protein 1 [Podochytrium sp. JEL0797]
MFSQFRRHLTTKAKPALSHVDSAGKASMVNVSIKTPKHRTAAAKATVRFSTAMAFETLRGNAMAKGDVLCVAKLAGINAAKQTGLLIPLAHPLLLTHVDLSFELLDATNQVDITCKVECVERTGVEVEAVLGASVAAVTVFDMCKAVDKAIVIENIHVQSKTGGKSDYRANH